MRLAEEVNRYCPYCKERTKQKVSVAKQKSRSATHPMSRGGKSRLKARGLTSGPGNHGKYSRRPPKQQKMKSKQTKRLPLMYTCKTCKKSKGTKKAIRTSRINIGDKVYK